MRVVVDLDDELIAECEHRTPDISWSTLIAAALRFAIEAADAEQHDSEPSDDEADDQQPAAS